MSFPSNITVDQPGESRTQAFLALGSNLPSTRGSPAATVVAAMDEIAGWSEQPLLRSSLWSSAPVDCPPGSPPFVNAVVAMVPRPSESPHSLLKKMLELEQCFGRKPVALTNAPRCLDLDLISFCDKRLADADLILPHPRAHDRSFVLFPLAEIAPDLRLPGQTSSVVELVRRLDASVSEIDRIEQ